MNKKRFTQKTRSAAPPILFPQKTLEIGRTGLYGPSRLPVTHSTLSTRWWREKNTDPGHVGESAKWPHAVFIHHGTLVRGDALLPWRQLSDGSYPVTVLSHLCTMQVERTMYGADARRRVWRTAVLVTYICDTACEYTVVNASVGHSRSVNILCWLCCHHHYHLQLHQTKTHAMSLFVICPSFSLSRPCSC